MSKDYQTVAHQLGWRRPDPRDNDGDFWKLILTMLAGDVQQVSLNVYRVHGSNKIEVVVGVESSGPDDAGMISSGEYAISARGDALLSACAKFIKQAGGVA